jgi:Zc3h12a-like Ribonuclease NYN domain
MSARYVVVDGSNLATEGRSMPSLAQLDQAVREFLAEHPKDLVTVVVDASFGHRIDPSELATFEEAEEAGEIISPPAGAIGRGDAFLLRISEKTGATVLSNDSFQEFHGDHPWLFEKGRLVGGKPVPGVGWIFMERSPVRGQKSREVVKEAKRRKKGGDAEAPESTSGLDLAAARSKGGRPKSVDRAIARATQEVVEPKSESSSRRRRAGRPPSDPVNEPLAFITFIAAHPLGSEVVGTVSEYSSHGAVVTADGARCYMPLSAMGNPPPRKAREVVTKGESGLFVVQAFDPLRRGIELALPGFATITGVPTPETVEAEIRQEGTEPRRARKSKKAAAVAVPVPSPELEAAAPKKRAAARKAAPGKKAAAEAALAVPAPGATPSPVGSTTKKQPVKKVAAQKEPAQKVAAKKAPPKKPVAKKAAPKKAAAKTPAATKAVPAAKTAPAPAATATKRTAAKKKPAKAASPAKKRS